MVKKAINSTGLLPDYFERVLVVGENNTLVFTTADMAGNNTQNFREHSGVPFTGLKDTKIGYGRSRRVHLV